MSDKAPVKLNPEEMEPSAKAFYRFAEEFAAESDRAAVILGAAKLDLLLLQTLKAYLLPCSTGRDELLDGDSPLSTFSARINACYRIGLITAEFAKCLHLVRRIRNSFAHESSGVSLDSGAHADRVRELILPFRQNHGFTWLMEQHFSKKAVGIPQQFRGAVALLSLRLEGCLEQTKPIDAQPMGILPPALEEESAEAEKDTGKKKT